MKNLEKNKHQRFENLLISGIKLIIYNLSK
jgi:hypothetical protein